MVDGSAPLFLAFVGSYLLGSIPFGLLLTRLAGLGDIRKIGSGNIGATNVLRTGNKPLALVVLLLDSGKGAVAVLLAGAAMDEHAGLAAGFGAVLGHLFPVWLGFKGGKGVATTIGTLLALAWPVGLIACGLWLLTALIFRMSSAAALTAIAATPIAAYFLGSITLAISALLLAALVWFKHAANIGRLLSGTEPRISLGGKAK
ncbi:MAG: plsY [Rhodospirillales bacterium]|nr:plsY [Rhodospirillales bacterium]